MVPAVALSMLMSIRGLPQDPAPGIAAELAVQRATRVANVSYALRFELGVDPALATGTLVLKFELADDAAPADDLVLDFGGDRLDVFDVNGRALVTEVRRVHDHLVIPAAALSRGGNLIEARFASAVAATGTPLTRYHDATDGADYLYTLLVPADAHRLFPCFDQPDLKARFTLSLSVPGTWTAVANGAATNDPRPDSFPEVPREQPDGRRAFTFESTQPLSTYLFAFAAGPFEVVEDSRGSGVGPTPSRPIRMYVRPSRREFVDDELLFRMHRDALAWLGTWFDVPYAFGKLDFVLLPGFPYGGMEHAGAIFYRETALSFERPPTESERVRRSALIYHEVAHQWFGNLVTMRWFDDLWLKEGFATFLGYTLVDALEPGRNAWLRFHQRVKPRAYEVDATAGTTPIYQALDNLANAKSAYGAIVYNKAPAVLRELEARLGAEEFRSGVRLFVQQHAFGNATWRDLIDALHRAGGLRGDTWPDRWILGRGVPRVQARWSTDDEGRLASFSIEQRSTDDATATWPMSLQVLLLDRDGTQRRITTRADALENPLEALVGTPGPVAVLLNPTDVAYGLFLLDPTSQEYLVTHTAAIEDPMARAIAVSALQQTVSETLLDPQRFADLLLALVERETDPDTHDWLLEKLGTVLERWLADARADDTRQRIEEELLEQLSQGRSGTELQSVRFLAWHGRSSATRELLGGLLDGSRTVAGLQLEPRDRFLAAAALAAAGDSEPLVSETSRAGAKDVGKWEYLARAAIPDDATKRQWFESYLRLDDPPEQWVQDSLPFFHWPGQEARTLPYLVPALDRVDWVKRNRKIFFMPAWIDGFVNGHSSPDAATIVHDWMDAHPDLESDVRLKLLQSLDGLDRATRIRARWK